MNSTPKHRVALYARVSTPGQAQRDLSIPEQLAALRAFCAEQRWDVVTEFTDKGISGGKVAARVQFSRMVKMGLETSPPFTLILTRDASRFGRGDEDPGLRAKLRANGVEVDNIESPSGGMWGAITPQQKYFERVQWANDVRQREEVSPRVIASQRRAALEGRFPGASGTVYGYRQVYLGNGPRPKRTVELDPVKAQIVREMFERYADGGSLHSVTRWLNESGAPTPKNARQWYAPTVRRILRNRTVLGDIIYGRLTTKTNPTTEKPRYVPSNREPVVFRGAFPALVPLQLFEAVQVRLDQNERRRPLGGNPENLVRGLAVCSHCGWGLAFQQRSGRWYYLCESKKQQSVRATPCCSGALPAAHVNAVVLDYLTRLVGAREYRATLAKAVQIYNESLLEYKAAPEIEIIAATIKALEHNVENLVRAIANGIDSLAVKDKLHETENRLNEARARHHELTVALRSIPKLDAKRVLDVASGLRQAVKNGDIARIKTLLSELVARIEVDFTKRRMRAITFDVKVETPDAFTLLKETYPEMTIRPVDDEVVEKAGGQDAFADLMTRVASSSEARLASVLAHELETSIALKRAGVSYRRDDVDGRITTIMSTGAPLTFVNRWDLANLALVSRERLRKVGAIMGGSTGR